MGKLVRKMYNNKVIGNRKDDNKQAGNRQKAKSSSENGTFGTLKGEKLSPQNSPQGKVNETSQKGSPVIKAAEAHAKKIIRKGAMYTEGAINAAKRARGM